VREKLIDMLTRHEIQVLRRAGHALVEVAGLSSASIGTVRRVVDENAVTTVDNERERNRRQIGRPSKAEAYREVLLAALADDLMLRTVELLLHRPGAAHPGQCRPHGGGDPRDASLLDAAGRDRATGSVLRGGSCQACCDSRLLRIS
jgi:hypothetical protein